MDPLNETNPDDQSQDNLDESTSSEGVSDVASDSSPFPEMLSGGEVAAVFPELESAAAAIEIPLPSVDFAADAEALSIEAPISQFAEHFVEFPTDLPLTEQWFAGAGLASPAPFPVADIVATEHTPRGPSSDIAHGLGSVTPYAEQSSGEPGVGYRLPLIGSQANDPQGDRASGGNFSKYPLLMTPPILLVAFDDRQQQIEAELEAFAERMNAMCKSHADAAVDYLRWCLYTEDRALYGG